MGVARGIPNMGLRPGVDGVMLTTGETGLDESTGPRNKGSQSVSHVPIISVM